MAMKTMVKKQNQLDRQRNRQCKSSHGTEDRAIRLSTLRTSQRRRLEIETSVNVRVAE